MIEIGAHWSWLRFGVGFLVILSDPDYNTVYLIYICNLLIVIRSGRRKK